MSGKRTVWQRIRKPVISAVIILAAAAAVVSVARIPGRTEVVPPVEVPPVNVVVAKVKAIPSMPDLLELPGNVEPNRIVEVPVELAGRIQNIFRQEGHRVEKGDVLLKLDTALLEAELRRAEAQANFDQRSHGRSAELLKRGVVKKSEVDELEARMLVSRAALEVARTNLERATIYAPLSGVLNDLLREEGEFVSRGDPVAQIVDVERLKIVAQIPERDVQFLRLGALVEIQTGGPKAGRMRGPITFIGEVADRGTRTTPIEITLENQQHRLRSGMIVRVLIQRRTLRNVVMVPLSSVIPLEAGRVVYVVADGVAERREVELGVIRGTRVQVLEGLEPGEMLIVSGHRQVGPGQKVDVVEAG